jgi:actin-related protein
MELKKRLFGTILLVGGSTLFEGLAEMIEER